MRKMCIFGLFIILCMTMFTSAGCKDSSEKTTESEVNEAGETPVEVIEFTLHHQDPPSAMIGVGLETWARLVEEKTEGNVRITVYPSATLGPGSKGLELVRDGIADIAWGSIGLYSGRFPLSELLSLPMLGLESGAQSSMIAWNLYEKSPEMQKEWEDPNVKLINIYCGGYVPIGIDKEVKSVADFKGPKIRTVAGGPADLLTMMGASPIVAPAGEIYQQVERGVMDGWAIDWQGAKGFRLTEISPYILEFKTNYEVNTHFIVMNKKSYDKIPDEYKEKFDALCGEFFAVHMGKAFDSLIEPTKEEYTGAGNKLIMLPEQEEQKVVEMAIGVQEKYAKQLDGKGLAGTKTLETIRGLAKEITVNSVY
ncbi:MAG: TRAP transporter substrate-binding protein DctP [Dehalobacterium sp.]